MLKPDELKYIEEQIKKMTASITHTHFQMVMGEEVDYYHEEFPGWTKSWLRMRISDLYYMLLTYLEGRGMNQLLDTFKEKYSKIIADDDLILKSEIMHPEGESELVIIEGFKQFLEPFKAFDYRNTKEDEIIKLKSILKNTGFILKNSSIKKIKNEADIYKTVKWIIGLYYPSCRLRNKASFIHEFKCYNPDILIPELKTAIEYKYLNSPTDNIDEFLDQIRIDATNYTGDYRYETFIAVIFIEDVSIATPESIEVAWKAKHFPNEWELIVAGNSITT